MIIYKVMALKFNVIVREDDQSLRVSKTLCEEALKAGLVLEEGDPNFVFSVGGDGTFLKAVHKYLRKVKNIKFIGIHTGSLGFFADFRPADIKELLKRIKSEELNTKSYKLVKAEITQNGKKRNFYAVNEVRIENVHHTLVLDVYLNEELLEVYRGNGVLVATQLGSTGYNKSLGGAVINRNLELLEYTKIAPIANSAYRPLVNPLIIGEKDVLVFNSKNTSTYFGYDSFTKKLSNVPFSVKVSLSTKKITIVHRQNRPYSKILNESFLGGKHDI
ncbi:MAG: putative inorganic polyphosphate/ATP-NAD kinase 1 [Tenericutes bacterium ADurb.Bin239]|nr:MAG: putative inorganic polyphosphate/ATP-NAD kinase 1 [Tenericutes bacterium ADurb.Bin239]